MGLATARALAEAGASITIADISPADTVVDDLNKRGFRAQYVQCDTSDWEAQHAAFKKAVELSDSGALHAVALFAAVDKTPHLVDIVKQPLFAGEDISKQGHDARAKRVQQAGQMVQRVIRLICTYSAVIIMNKGVDTYASRRQLIFPPAPQLLNVRDDFGESVRFKVFFERVPIFWRCL